MRTCAHLLSEAQMLCREGAPVLAGEELANVSSSLSLACEDTQLPYLHPVSLQQKFYWKESFEILLECLGSPGLE